VCGLFTFAASIGALTGGALSSINTGISTKIAYDNALSHKSKQGTFLGF
jgi:hypothetical protein